MKVGIIGAGPAGLTCASELVKGGVSVDVYEAEDAVGGMTKSFELWGQRVDLGPHRFFSMDDRITGFWLEHTKGEYIMVDRLTRIFYKKKFFLYPVRAFNALRNLGIGEAFLCIMSYFKAQFHRKGEEKSFEEWVSNRFGYKLYSIFFKSYSERLWGIPCTELDADFARQRIKGLNMLEVIKSAVFGGGGAKHKTLVDRFAYPKQGASVPYETITAGLREKGAGVYLSTPVRGIRTKDGKAVGIILEDGSVREYDYIVSTAPFTRMVCSIPELSAVHGLAQELKYRNTTLVYLLINKTDIFKDNWIYVHDKTVNMGRITNFRNWSPFMLNGKKEAILCLEYWSYDGDAMWQKSDADMIAMAKEEIVRTGLVQADDVMDGSVVKLHRSYPVYNTGYQEKMQKLQEACDAIGNLAFIGRNGSFKYNNQDHSILMGLLAAENILTGTRKHNLWRVNTDYDYQEGKSRLVEEKQ